MVFFDTVLPACTAALADFFTFAAMIAPSQCLTNLPFSKTDTVYTRHWGFNVQNRQHTLLCIDPSILALRLGL
jgi:hypothetical protein